MGTPRLGEHALGKQSSLLITQSRSAELEKQTLKGKDWTEHPLLPPALMLHARVSQAGLQHHIEKRICFLALGLPQQLYSLAGVL